MAGLEGALPPGLMRLTPLAGSSALGLLSQHSSREPLDWRCRRPDLSKILHSERWGTAIAAGRLAMHAARSSRYWLKQKASPEVGHAGDAGVMVVGGVDGGGG